MALYRHWPSTRAAGHSARRSFWGERVTRALHDIFSHRTLRRRDVGAGLAHTGIFYGYLFGIIATTLYFIEIDILHPLAGITFVKGHLYLIMSLLLDLGHLALTCGLIYMMMRRATFNLPKLDYLRANRKETQLAPRGRALAP